MGIYDIDWNKEIEFDWVNIAMRLILLVLGFAALYYSFKTESFLMKSSLLPLGISFLAGIPLVGKL